MNWAFSSSGGLESAIGAHKKKHIDNFAIYFLNCWIHCYDIIGVTNLD